MELEEFRASQRSLSHSLSAESFGEDEGEAILRGAAHELSMMEYRHLGQQPSTVYGASSYRRPSNGSSTAYHPLHQHHLPSSGHPWARSRSTSSLSNVSCDSDSEMVKSSAKSSPIGSDSSMGNYDYGQTESGACPATPIGSSFAGGEMGSGDLYEMDGWNPSASPSPEELSEVFMWVDETNDGLICGSDLRGFMSRVLAFEISEGEAETLLLLYSNGRTLRSGAGAVVDFDGFLALYQCICGEQASPEEQSMMAAASRVFDKSQLQSDRWA